MALSKKIHYSVCQDVALCGVAQPIIAQLRSQVNCRMCRRLMRHSFLGKQYVHTLIAVGTSGDKTVYIDVPLEVAKRRYIEVNGDNPRSRLLVEAAETHRVGDEFGAHDIWAKPPTKKRKHQKPAAQRPGD